MNSSLYKCLTFIATIFTIIGFSPIYNIISVYFEPKKLSVSPPAERSADTLQQQPSLPSVSPRPTPKAPERGVDQPPLSKKVPQKEQPRIALNTKDSLLPIPVKPPTIERNNFQQQSILPSQLIKINATNLGSSLISILKFQVEQQVEQSNNLRDKQITVDVSLDVNNQSPNASIQFGATKVFAHVTIRVLDAYSGEKLLLSGKGESNPAFSNNVPPDLKEQALTRAVNNAFQGKRETQ